MPKKPKSQKKYAVSAEEFVIAWNTSRSAQEVADKVRMPVPIVHARASKYRKAGVRLKEHRTGSGRALDVEKLNALIEKLDREKTLKALDTDVVDEVVETIVKKVLERLEREGT